MLARLPRGSGNAANGRPFNGPSGMTSSRFSRHAVEQSRRTIAPRGCARRCERHRPGAALRPTHRWRAQHFAAPEQLDVAQLASRQQPSVAGRVAHEVREHRRVWRAVRLAASAAGLREQSCLPAATLLRPRSLASICARVSTIARRSSSVPASSASCCCMRISSRSCCEVSLRAQCVAARRRRMRRPRRASPASRSASERARTSSAVRNARHAAASRRPGRRRQTLPRCALRRAGSARKESARATRDSPTSTRMRLTMATASSAAPMAPGDIVFRQQRLRQRGIGVDAIELEPELHVLLVGGAQVLDRGRELLLREPQAAALLERVGAHQHIGRFEARRRARRRRREDRRARATRWRSSDASARDIRADCRRSAPTCAGIRARCRAVRAPRRRCRPGATLARPRRVIRYVPALRWPRAGFRANVAASPMRKYKPPSASSCRACSRCLIAARRTFAALRYAARARDRNRRAQSGRNRSCRASPRTESADARVSISGSSCEYSRAASAARIPGDSEPRQDSRAT